MIFLMEEEFLKFLSAYLMSTLKFIAGPTMGAAFGFTFLETYAVTVLGMMTTVFVFVWFGKPIRRWYNSIFTRKKRKFTKANRRFVYLWRHYGLIGVSMLTPVVFSPVVGVLLVTLWEKKRLKIVFWMLISALVWGVIHIKFYFTMKDLLFS